MVDKSEENTTKDSTENGEKTEVSLEVSTLKHKVQILNLEIGLVGKYYTKSELEEKEENKKNLTDQLLKLI